MRLFNLRRTWNQLARKDPLWAVLTNPEKRGQRWQLDEFFSTGVAEVAAKLAKVRQYYPALRTGSALDFGCGVGRLTQALGQHFEHVVGLDIAEDMLVLARRYNRHGDKVQYQHNARTDLRLFKTGSFDLVCSLITLQHMQPAYARAYIAEFVRVCAPGGIIFFQIPAHRPEGAAVPQFERLKFSWWPPTLSKRVWRILCFRINYFLRTWKLWPELEMEMHGIPHEEICALLEQHQARLLASYPNDSAGATLRSFDYIAMKQIPIQTS